MVPRSMWYETDLTEPKNCVFKAKYEFSILTFILLKLKSKIVPLRKIPNIYSQLFAALA